MVGAGDDVLLTSAFDQFVAPVRADIIEAANCAIAAFCDEDTRARVAKRLEPAQ